MKMQSEPTQAPLKRAFLIPSLSDLTHRAPALYRQLVLCFHLYPEIGKKIEDLVKIHGPWDTISSEEDSSTMLPVLVAHHSSQSTLPKYVRLAIGNPAQKEYFVAEVYSRALSDKAEGVKLCSETVDKMIENIGLLFRRIRQDHWMAMTAVEQLRLLRVTIPVKDGMKTPFSYEGLIRFPEVKIPYATPEDMPTRPSTQDFVTRKEYQEHKATLQKQIQFLAHGPMPVPVHKGRELAKKVSEEPKTVPTVTRPRLPVNHYVTSAKNKVPEDTVPDIKTIPSHSESECGLDGYQIVAKSGTDSVQGSKGSSSLSEGKTPNSSGNSQASTENPFESIISQIKAVRDSVVSPNPAEKPEPIDDDGETLSWIHNRAPKSWINADLLGGDPYDLCQDPCLGSINGVQGHGAPRAMHQCHFANGIFGVEAVPTAYHAQPKAANLPPRNYLGPTSHGPANIREAGSFPANYQGWLRGIRGTDAYGVSPVDDLARQTELAAEEQMKRYRAKVESGH